MRSVVYTLALVTFLSIANTMACAQETTAQETTAQETTVQENLEYGKLKVLEPLVGKYRGEGISEATSEKWESELTIFWSDTKKMLVARFTNRITAADGDLTQEGWKQGGHHYYLWSQASERIEFYQMRLPQGIVNVRTVEPKGEGTFIYPQLSTTASPAEKADMSVTVNDEEIAMKLTNYVDASGKAQEDVLIVFERVE